MTPLRIFFLSLRILCCRVLRQKKRRISRVLFPSVSSSYSISKAIKTFFMGNEQTSGTNDHFSPNRNKEHRRGSLTWATKVPSNTPKPSWHTARDISMDILSRKNTKLTFKKGTFQQRSITSFSLEHRKFCRSSIESKHIKIDQ